MTPEPEITEAHRLAAAQAIYDDPGYRSRHNAVNGVTVDGPAHDYARLVLAAIAPALMEQGRRVGREEAAKVAEGSYIQECCGFGVGYPPECCAAPNVEAEDPKNIAAAIRKLGGK